MRRVVASSASFGRSSSITASSAFSCATLSARPAFSNASMLSWCCFAMRRRIAVHASSETVAALSFFCSSRNAARAARSEAVRVASFAFCAAVSAAVTSS